MTEKLLRSVLKEAQEKDQVGLLIWANWRVWDSFSFDTKPGDKSYDFALSQIFKEEEATISLELSGFSMPAIMAVSVKKLGSSNKFFSHVLSICENEHYEGPITFVPSNEVSAFY